MNEVIRKRAKNIVYNKVKSSYKEEDCTLLIEDISDIVTEITIEEKERLINVGVSYSETLTKEYLPTSEYLKIFFDEVENKKTVIAEYIAYLSKHILKNRGQDVILVSLARGGTPIGILIKRYIKFKYNINIKHYSISVIRGRGLDYNALTYIINENNNDNILFVDGWTGKGSITSEIEKSIKIYNETYKTNIKDELAVVLDPANVSRFYGSREDLLLPNALLNATVSGLISRTVDKYCGEYKFHGAKYYEEYKDNDLSNFFIDSVSKEFCKMKPYKNIKLEGKTDKAYETLNYIIDKYKVSDINKIKLSIGEASRVLLRRKAKLIILNSVNSNEVRHIKLLAKEKGVALIEDENIKYTAIAIIE